MKAAIVGVDGSVTEGDRDGLDDLQKAVGGYIEALPFPMLGDVTCYINEEGKMLDLPLNEFATGIHKPHLMNGDYIAGPMVVMGFDPNEGENRPIPEPVWNALKLTEAEVYGGN